MNWGTFAKRFLPGSAIEAWCWKSTENRKGGPVHEVPELRLSPAINPSRGDHCSADDETSEHCYRATPSQIGPPNGSRLSCGALVKKQSYNILRAPPASSAC